MKISKVGGGEFGFQGPPVRSNLGELVSWGLGGGLFLRLFPPSPLLHPPHQGPVSRAGEILEGFLLVKHKRDGAPLCWFLPVGVLG